MRGLGELRRFESDLMAPCRWPDSVMWVCFVVLSRCSARIRHRGCTFYLTASAARRVQQFLNHPVLPSAGAVKRTKGAVPWRWSWQRFPATERRTLYRCTLLDDVGRSKAILLDIAATIPSAPGP